jgi:hypothetical protein
MNKYNAAKSAPRANAFEPTEDSELNQRLTLNMDQDLIKLVNRLQDTFLNLGTISGFIDDVPRLKYPGQRRRVGHAATGRGMSICNWLLSKP